MFALLRPLFALLIAVAFLIAGTGLLGTLLPVRGSLSGLSDTSLGLIGSGYFLGFVVGTLGAPPLIRRVGHIRAFAISAAIATSAILLLAIRVDPWAWIVLRVVIGVALVCLYTTIESWLGAQAPEKQRGQVFAVYMGVNLIALALGQQLLRVASVEGFELFTVVAALTCLALVPVAWTRLPQPVLADAPPYSLSRLYAEVPSAAAGGLLNGMAMGAYWSMTPLFGARLSFSSAEIATFMTISILGGACLQWPLGRWSDRIDRRRVLYIVSALAAAFAIAMIFAAEQASLRLWIIFGYGALAFSIYPICVAHLMDRLEPNEMLGASSRFLLIYGLGAAIGPALAGLAMERFGPKALFALFAVVQGLLVLFILLRMRARAADALPNGHFLPMLRTTPAVMELLPEEPQRFEAGRLGDVQ